MTQGVLIDTYILKYGVVWGAANREMSSITCCLGYALKK